jgi:hypothetical protein
MAAVNLYKRPGSAAVPLANQDAIHEQEATLAVAARGR